MSLIRRASHKVRVMASRLRRPALFDSGAYWEDRYATGGNSGRGPYGSVAMFKARVLNELVAKHDLRKVIEFGCGDGHQLGLASCPSYVGYDVSETAIDLRRARFAGDDSTQFVHFDPATFAGIEPDDRADLTLSLEVIFHLIRDDVFERHMQLLFDGSRNFVAIFSSDTNENLPNRAVHFCNRQFSPWVAAQRPEFELVEVIPFSQPPGEDPIDCVSDFHIYARR